MSKIIYKIKTEQLQNLVKYDFVKCNNGHRYVYKTKTRKGRFVFVIINYQGFINAYYTNQSDKERTLLNRTELKYFCPYLFEHNMIEKEVIK